MSSQPYPATRIHKIPRKVNIRRGRQYKNNRSSVGLIYHEYKLVVRQSYLHNDWFYIAKAIDFPTHRFGMVKISISKWMLARYSSSMPSSWPVAYIISTFVTLGSQNQTSRCLFQLTRFTQPLKIWKSFCSQSITPRIRIYIRQLQEITQCYAGGKPNS